MMNYFEKLLFQELFSLESFFKDFNISNCSRINNLIDKIAIVLIHTFNIKYKKGLNGDVKIGK